MHQSKNDIEMELEYYKKLNSDFLSNLEKSQVVASYNMRLAALSGDYNPVLIYVAEQVPL